MTALAIALPLAALLWNLPAIGHGLVIATVYRALGREHKARPGSRPAYTRASRLIDAHELVNHQRRRR